jgi:chromosome partitioning protein
MKVITVAAPKGGSGKTTIASALSVRAVEEGHSVVMMDLNADQGDLTRWWINRGEPQLPALLEVEKLSDDIRHLSESGWQWCIIDTPPTDLDLIEMAVICANAVIVPVRASFFDITAVEPIVEMCTQHKRPFGFVRSAVDPKFKSLNAQAQTALVETGTLLAAHTSYRLDYINAVTVGKTGYEINADLKGEIDLLWAETKRLATHPWQSWGVAHVR